MILDTGTPRSVKGHAASGAFIAFVLTAAKEYAKTGQKDKRSLAKTLIKAALEGGIITASGIAAANALGDKDKGGFRNVFEALFCVGAGIAGVYAVDKFMSGEKIALLDAIKPSKAPIFRRTKRAVKDK